MKWAEMTKEERKLFKELMHDMHNQHKARRCLPLCDEPRMRCKPNDYESVYEYGMLGYGLSDERIEEIMNDMELRNCTPYDCSGKLVTAWLNVHRNKSGLITFVHCMVLDI